MGLASIIADISKLARYGRESFALEAKDWFGRKVLPHPLVSLQEIAKAGKLFSEGAYQAEELNRSLGIIKCHIKELDPENRLVLDAIKEITLPLKQTTSLKVPYSASLISAEKLETAIVSSWVKEIHIYFICRPLGYELAFSPALSYCLDDALLQKIFTLISSTLAEYPVTHFDFARYPRLGREAPGILFSFYRDRLNSSCFRYLADSESLLDHTLIVEGQKIRVNSSLLAKASLLFDTMWKSAVGKRNAEETELPDMEFQSVKECMDCLIGLNDPSCDNDTSRLSSVLQNAHKLNLFQIADRAGERLFLLLKDMIKGRDGLLELGDELQQTFDTLRLYIEDSQLPRTGVAFECLQKAFEQAFPEDMYEAFPESEELAELSDVELQIRMMRTFSKRYPFAVYDRSVTWDVREMQKNLERNKNKITNDTAIEVFKAFAGIYSSHSQAQFVIGKFLSNFGEHALAKECFERAILLNPNHDEALCHLADLLFRGTSQVPKDAARAKQLLEDAMKRGRCHYLVYITYAVAVLRNDRAALFALFEPFLKDLEEGKTEGIKKLWEGLGLEYIACYLLYLLVQGQATDIERAKKICASLKKKWEGEGYDADRYALPFAFVACLRCKELEPENRPQQVLQELQDRFQKAGFFETAFVEDMYDALPLGVLKQLEKIKKQRLEAVCT